VKTAICAGVAVWVLGSLLPNLSFMWVAGLFSHHLCAYTTAGALVETVVGAIAALLFTRNKPTGFIRTNLNPNNSMQKSAGPSTNPLMSLHLVPSH
jgi:hypothetical protein